MRTLIYVPLVHTFYESMPVEIRADLLAEPDLRRSIADIGRRVNACWYRVRKDIARIIRTMPAGHPRVLVWRDGLIVDLRPRPSVRCPPQRYPTHATLVWLYRQGARICATEDLKILRMQFKSIRLQLDLPRDPEALAINRDILAIRDFSVAQRILNELGEDQTGILLMGADHHVDRIIRKVDPQVRIVRVPHFQEVNRQVARILAAT